MGRMACTCRIPVRSKVASPEALVVFVLLAGGRGPGSAAGLRFPSTTCELGTGSPASSSPCSPAKKISIPSWCT